MYYKYTNLIQSVEFKVALLVGLAVTLIVAYTYFSWRNPGRNIEVRDGFFGISGILHNKSLLAEAGVECHIYGFFLGASGAQWNKSLKLNTKNILYTVRNGTTPVVTFLADRITDESLVRENVKKIVEYYTTGDGYKLTGYKVVYWQIGNEENGFWGTSCSAVEYAEGLNMLKG